MKLIISGRPIGKGVDQMMIRRAAKYMVGLLMAEDVSRMKAICVEICFNAGFKEDFGRVAECNWLDNPLRPNSFYIDFDSALSHKSALITLGHELVHVKQMAFGQRFESPDGTSIWWMGQLYKPGDIHYYDLPWEVEAHGREFGLYDRFVQSEQNVELRPATIIDPGSNLRTA